MCVCGDDVLPVLSNCPDRSASLSRFLFNFHRRVDLLFLRPLLHLASTCLPPAAVCADISFELYLLLMLALSLRSARTGPVLNFMFHLRPYVVELILLVSADSPLRLRTSWQSPDRHCFTSKDCLRISFDRASPLTAYFAFDSFCLFTLLIRFAYLVCLFTCQQMRN